MVERLDFIKADKEARDRIIIPMRLFNFFFEAFQKETPVAQAGQGIGVDGIMEGPPDPRRGSR